jgi:Ca2+-binding RTX toxin-like protein
MSTLKFIKQPNGKWKVYETLDWGEILDYWQESFGQNSAQFSLSYTSTTPVGSIVVAMGTGFSYGGGVPDGGTVSGFRIEDADGNRLVEVTGISAPADVFFASVTNNSQRYPYLVGLLDDATAVTGGTAGEAIEVGAGNDTVNADAGDDVVFKWGPGKLTYDGGAGSDTIVFQAATGVVNPGGATNTAAVNLGNGTGTNPFGGLPLTLISVENVVGTEKADDLTGSNADNIFGDGIYDIGADIINALGGNDRVNLAEGDFGNPGGVRADGGAGIDTVAVNLGLFGNAGPTAHRLDLTNQASNTGVFKNDVLTGFEVFEDGKGFFANAGHSFTFIDTNDNAGRSVAALGQTNTLSMKGGDDTVVLGYWRPKAVADGGAGKDTVAIAAFAQGQTNVLDFANQSKNTGVFAGSVFSNFEAVDASETTVGLTGTSFEFRGGKGAESVIGSALADILDGGGGNDRVGGGPGDDVVTGGRGKDTFVISGPVNAFVNVDEIADFKPKDDMIELDKSVFAAPNAGKLKAKHFVLGKKAKDGNDHVIYNKKNGGVYYDEDGKGDDPMVQFAQLDKKLAMTNADFFVV